MISLLLCFSLGSAQAFSIRDLLGLDDDEKKAETAAAEEKKKQSNKAADNNWAKSGDSNAAVTQVDLDLIKRLLANLESNKRAALLNDEKAFAQFVNQEAGSESVLAAAKKNNLHKDANARFLMQRGASNILRELYINRLIQEKLPDGFPTDEQIQEYYDKNRDKFVVARRVHIWQIFLPTEKSMDEKTIAGIRKEASGIAQKIKNKKLSFNEAASKHSKHTPSNTNGGYMGLIKTSDLKPDIQEVVLKLKEGELSKALTTDTGIHIVKRGAIVPERQVTLEEGRPQIQQLLVKQVNAQLRKAIFEQASKTYPAGVSETKVEEWRLRLKTNTDGAP